MTVSVQGSDGQTVLFQTRKVKASDLETDASLLDLDDIPMPTGITDSNNASYSNFSSFVTDLSNNNSIQGPQGVQGPAIDSVSLAQSVDLSTVTMTFGYTQNSQNYTIATTPSFSIPAGPTGPTGTGIQLVSHDPQNDTLTFQFTDTLSDLTVNLPQGDTGPAGRGISSISKSGDVMTINFDDGSSPTQLSGITGPAGSAATVTVSATNTLAAGASATVTETGTSNSQNRELIFGIPAGADGADGVSVTDVNQVNASTINFDLSNGTTTSNVTIPNGVDGVSVTGATLGTDVNNSANYAITFDFSNNTTDVVTFAKPNDGADGVSITGATLGTDANNSANYALTINYSDNTSDIVTFEKPTNGVDGTDGVSITGATLGTDVNNSANYAITFNLSDNTTDVVTFAKPTNGTDGTDGVSVTGVNQVNSTTINFSLSNSTNTSNITLPSYTLPTATANDLGGIKVGTNLSISNGVLSATDTNTTYSLADASNDGLLSSSDFTKLSGIATNANNFSLPTYVADQYLQVNSQANGIAWVALGSAANSSTTDFASAAQGTLADTAIQPADLATVATTGNYNDLTNLPSASAVDPVVMALALG